MAKRRALLRGDDSAAVRGNIARGQVYRLLPKDVEAAVVAARGIDHPWYRCQSLAVAAEAITDATQRIDIVSEAFRAADELDEPNRIVTVASWPVGVLAKHGPRDRLLREIHR